MSDLAGGRPAGSSGNGRAQNGGSRSAPGPVPVSQANVPRVKTPRDVWAQRQAREQQKKATEAATNRQELEDEEQARIEGDSRVSAERLAAAAGVANPPVKRVSGGDRGNGGNGGDQVLQEIPNESQNRRNERTTSDTTARRNVPTGSGVPVSAGTRVREPTTSIPRPPAESSRPRATSQPQQRGLTGSTRVNSATYTNQPPLSQTRLTSAGAGTTQAQAGPSVTPSFQQPSQQSKSQQPTGSANPNRNTNSSSFPHAFERWETLSSHWEGLTSYWMRRLDTNKEELAGQPINQQLARQVTDLSAAGANLFHAVVELQRLRASSERKFQRWFYETQSEQERTQERIAELENALRAEQQARAAGPARIDSERVAAQLVEAEEIKRNAEASIKEMRRELQISRDEARRGWEEIGRMEQNERDRTTSLRNGEPTLVGGVQVVPMLQGAGTSSNRPTTRDGPLPGDTGGLRGATQSPGDVGYTNYDPARSETDTDPFTEGGRDLNAAQRNITSAPSYPQSSQPGSAAAAILAARAAATSSHPVSPPRSNPPISTASPARGGTYLSYGPTGGSLPTVTPTSGAGFYQHQGTGTALLREEPGQRPRTTEGDERSYVPSVDTLSEEDYELDAQGYPRRDVEGQPRLARQVSDDSDEFNVDEQLARERAYGVRYGSAVSGVEYGTGSTAVAGGGFGGPSTLGVGGGRAGTTNGGSVDYSGSGYGWESVPRHHHPTRLSDVLEEDERSRTSPSRASERSRGVR